MYSRSAGNVRVPPPALRPADVHKTRTRCVPLLRVEQDPLRCSSARSSVPRLGTRSWRWRSGALRREARANHSPAWSRQPREVCRFGAGRFTSCWARRLSPRVGLPQRDSGGVIKRDLALHVPDFRSARDVSTAVPGGGPGEPRAQGGPGLVQPCLRPCSPWPPPTTTDFRGWELNQPAGPTIRPTTGWRG